MKRIDRYATAPSLVPEPDDADFFARVEAYARSLQRPAEMVDRAVVDQPGIAAAASLETSRARSSAFSTRRAAHAAP